MKNLEKNRNIYVQHGRFYIDYQKNGVRIRRSTGIKKSSFAFDFIRKNYDLFIGSQLDIEKARRKYYELEDIHTDKILRKREEGVVISKNDSEFSFDSVISKLLAEKSFLKDKTVKLYTTISESIIEFLRFKNIFYLSDFKREHSIDFIQFCKDKGFKDKTIKLYASFLKTIFKYGISNDLISKNPFYMPKFKKGLMNLRMKNLYHLVLMKLFR